MKFIDMPAPVVTILTPTYNQQAYIADCISSVQDQDFLDWEMIILDDGSTDNTVNEALNAARHDSRIQIMTQQNVGVFRLAETYNKGLAKAKGKYIAILEGDDFWLPGKLKLQIEMLEQHPKLVMSWGKSAMVNAEDTLIYSISPAETENIPPEILHNHPLGSVIKLSVYHAWVPALTAIIRKKNLEKIGGFIQSHGMPLVDYPTIVKLSTQGPFYFHDITLGKWRIYPEQTTKQHTVEIYEGVYAFVSEYLTNLTHLSRDDRIRILGYYLRQRFIAYARSGRYRLIRREFAQARQDYVKAILHPPVGEELWRLRAIIGLIFSFFHLDVEGLAKRLGRDSYSPTWNE